MQLNENKRWNDYEDLQDLLIYLFEQNVDPDILEATIKGQRLQIAAIWT